MVKKILYILFAVVSFAAIAEYVFICGAFTGPLAMFLVLITGGANIIVCIIEKDAHSALLFVIATLGLCMGYFKLMF